MYPSQKPFVFAKIKFDLPSVKLDSVFIIFLSSDAEVSNIFRYSILLSLSKWVSSYRFKSLTFLTSRSLSGSELNSSSGVFFVVSIHFSIKILILSFKRFEDDIDDFFFPI